MHQLNILLNGKPVDALSAIVHKSKVLPLGKSLVHRLKETIPKYAAGATVLGLRCVCSHVRRGGHMWSGRATHPRQLFEVVIQAAQGNKILARETYAAARLAHCCNVGVPILISQFSICRSGRTGSRRCGRTSRPNAYAGRRGG